jgi:AcrR family transcriptional regulator
MVVYSGGVADRQGFHAEVRALLEDRVLDAAAEMIIGEGWGAVTMSRIAAQVGVSRQLLSSARP